MALRWIEGFDDVATAAHLQQRYELAESGCSIDASGRNGQCAKLDATLALYKNFDAQSTWIVGIALKHLSTPTGVRDTIALYDISGASNQMKLALNTSRRLAVYRGTTLLATSTDVLLTGVWYYVEFKVVISNTGSYEVRLNGNTVLSASGINTQQTANAWADRVCWSGDFGARFDDIYVCDGSGSQNNTFLGDCKVITIRPNGAGTYTQWTPSAGANYENVDDNTPDDDTTYNYSATAGQIDTYAFGDVSLVGSIRGIQLAARIRKDDAGTRTLALMVRSGVTDYQSSSENVQDTYRFMQRVYETDPATGLLWTQAGLNAAEFGVKLVA